MITYESRLVAAMRSMGADDQAVQEARLSLSDYPSDDEVLTSEFGEPEDYAMALLPGAQWDRRAPFILAGLIVGLMVALLLTLARDLGWEPFASWNPLAPALGLLFLAAGVLAQFWRYQRRGRN